MLDTITHIVSFLLETIIIVAAILIIVAGLLSITSKNKIKFGRKIQTRKLNKHYQDMTDTLNDALLTKAEQKGLKKEKKKLKKTKKQTTKRKKCVFVIDFKGDLKATAVSSLREEVSAILSAAKKTDEVLIRLESAGGIVFGYGLAASQLKRIKDAGIPLTIAVDKIAASGGYMMACVGDKILSAPFAIIGSIGVIAQLPNFHRLLKKKDIDFEQITAGEFKRTLTLFGENTDTDRAKMQEDINEIHELFKQFVSTHRPQAKINEVATGEYWHGTTAKTLNLVDTLCTSDDYLMKSAADNLVLQVKFPSKKKFSHKFAEITQTVVERLFYSSQEKYL